MRSLYLTILFTVLVSRSLFAQQPNIVFILADDLGYGDLSSYGALDLKTPNIDKLSEEGIKFNNAYANSTVCSPSRAAILTGNYPDMVGVPGVVRDMEFNTWGNLADDIQTLPELLKKQGYNTALIGKWHLGYQSPDLPNDRGFDYFKGFIGDMMDDYYTHLRGGVNYMRENTTVINPKGHATDIFSDWAIDYINTQSKTDDPFFLFLTYNAPHDPIHPPTEYLEKSIKEHPNKSKKRQKLIALIEHLDDSVAKVLEAIEENKLSENTIIIFTSDNGGALNYGASNSPYRGGKGNMYEGGIRVPCIVKWGKKYSGEKSNYPLILMDFFPSLLSAAGDDSKLNLPSKVIKPLFGNVDVNIFSREMIWMRREGHKFGGRDYYSISDGEYKLLQNSPFEKYSLFNIKTDSLETEAIKNDSIKKVLKFKLTKHIQNAGKIPWQ